MKWWLALAIVLIPLSMLAKVHQSKLYLQARSAIGVMLRQQNQLLEENRRIIAEIARSSAPTAVEGLARSPQAKLRKIAPNQVLRIIVPEENDAP